MIDKNLIAYTNGKYKKLSDIVVSPMTHTLHYGTGVFEGIRSYETKKGIGIRKLPEHISRLFNSSSKLFMKIKENEEEVQEICKELLRKNNLKSAYIRPLVFLDDSSVGMQVGKNETQIFIVAFPWEKYLSDTVRVKISSIRRISEQTTAHDAKICGHYINSFMATGEAKNTNFDEPLLLDRNGAVAEGAVANVFFIKNNELITPKKDKIFPGLVRSSVLEIAKELDYNVVEKDIFPEEIEEFEGAFFTGTASEITIISEITLLNNKCIKFNENASTGFKNIYTDAVSMESIDRRGWFSII